ncbi:uncharacterized protein LOC123578461 [Leopardus geoffroyi]|uniref:uncharacterized protein LOC123578461 n=1 Tax=Leopardus geoffroyi TaxID=46844 RepID=UPI001E25E7F4|nr:uncharacterized protein LOC123578461 [Leopardus geoffroyi]
MASSRPSAGGSHLPAAPGNVLEAVLLLRPIDRSRVPARPRKSSRGHVAAAFQGFWKITTHIWRQASPPTALFQHQRMWLFSRIRWDLCPWGVLPEGEQPPMWPEDLALCSWGFAPPIRAPPGRIELNGSLEQTTTPHHLRPSPLEPMFIWLRIFWKAKSRPLLISPQSSPRTTPAMTSSCEERYSTSATKVQGEPVTWAGTTNLLTVQLRTCLRALFT